MPESTARRAPWRALAATAGAAVGIAGWLINEAVTHPGARLVGELPVQLAVMGGPVVLAAVVGYGLARWRPAMGSLAFTLGVTAIATIAGPLIMLAIGVGAGGWRSDHENWLGLPFALLLMAFFGIARVGPLALLAGWAAFYLIDRRVMARPLEPPAPAT